MNPDISHAGHTGTGSLVDLWSPGFLLFLVVVGVLYSLCVNRWRMDFKDSEPVSTKQQAYFWTGLTLWYIAEGSPLAFYGNHYYFSLHMLQQSILYLVMPPILLLGMPGWLLRAMLQKEKAQKVLRFLTHPVLTLFWFNFVFSLYHIPYMMDMLMINPILLTMYKFIFLVAAFQMWFSVFSPLPEYIRMSDIQKSVYIFLNGILLTPACALIIFASHPLYAMYANVPDYLLFMPLLEDQQFGGAIMKIIQEIVYGYALGFIFFRWYKKERKQETEEELEASGDAYFHANASTNRA